MEVIVSASPDKAFVKMRNAMRKAGTLRKIAPRLYTTNLEDSAEEITRRNLFLILENLFPKGVISHRSAVEFDEIQTGKDIFITYICTRVLTIPGYTVHLLEGPGGGKHDQPLGNLFVSGEERRMLEVLQRTRFGKGAAKSYPSKFVEKYLQRRLQEKGEAELLAFRDRAREVAEELAMTSEFETLTAMIAAILSQHT